MNLETRQSRSSPTLLAISMLALIACLSCSGTINNNGIIIQSTPRWGTAGLIETSDALAESPQIAMDIDGNAIVVWEQIGAFKNYNVLARRFANGSWKTAELLEADESGRASSSQQISMTGAGRAIAVWQRQGSGSYNISVNRFDGAAWGGAAFIDSNSVLPRDPQITGNDAGEAIAVWEDSYHIWANRFDGTSWGQAALIENNSDQAFTPQIAMDSYGNAICVWPQRNSSGFSIWAARFNGSYWGTAEMLANNSGTIDPPQIVMNGAGFAIVIWDRVSGSQGEIWVKSFNGNWGSVELIATGQINPNSYGPLPQIALNSAGNAVAVWQQFDGVRYNVYSSYFNGAVWSTTALIETQSAGDAVFPQVAINSSGKAFAVWQQSDGIRKNVWANRFDGAAWGAAELIEKNDNDAVMPRIAIDNDGKAIAVWTQNEANGGSSVWFNRFE
jgi:hypothetical protein